jgi:hypothetical protein
MYIWAFLSFSDRKYHCQGRNPVLPKKMPEGIHIWGGGLVGG